MSRKRFTDLEKQSSTATAVHREVPQSPSGTRVSAPSLKEQGKASPPPQRQPPTFDSLARFREILRDFCHYVVDLEAKPLLHIVGPSRGRDAFPVLCLLCACDSPVQNPMPFPDSNMCESRFIHVHFWCFCRQTAHGEGAGRASQQNRSNRPAPAFCAPSSCPSHAPQPKPKHRLQASRKFTLNIHPKRNFHSVYHRLR